MKIKLYSQYPRFNDFQIPKYIEWNNEGQVEAYHDIYLTAAVNNKNNKRKKIAIITEPRCVWHCLGLDVENFLLNNYNIFEYIFTFDENLLKLPNAKWMPFVGVWNTNDIPKIKNISMCCSNKDMCDGHRIRKQLADKLKNKIDVLGDYLGEARVNTKDIYSQYKYSVVLENEISEFYFTEKVLNAFANKCIPIYYGSPTILKLFNKNGIIFANIIDEIPTIIDNLNIADYEKNIDAINENFEEVKKYQCYEDYLYLTYQKELEALWK